MTRILCLIVFLLRVWHHKTTLFPIKTSLGSQEEPRSVFRLAAKRFLRRNWLVNLLLAKVPLRFKALTSQVVFHWVLNVILEGFKHFNQKELVYFPTKTYFWVVYFRVNLFFVTIFLNVILFLPFWILKSLLDRALNVNNDVKNA